MTSSQSVSLVKPATIINELVGTVIQKDERTPLIKSRDEMLTTLSQNTDPRHEKPEYRAIIAVMDDINGEGMTTKEILESVNAEYICEPPLLSYNQLWRYITNDLLPREVLLRKHKTFSVQNQKFILNPKYATTKRIEYLPVSTYSIALFFILVLVFAGSVVSGLFIIQSMGALMLGFLFLVAQHFGSEFTLKK